MAGSFRERPPRLHGGLGERLPPRDKTGVGDGGWAEWEPGPGVTARREPHALRCTRLQAKTVNRKAKILQTELTLSLLVKQTGKEASPVISLLCQVPCPLQAIDHSTSDVLFKCLQDAL